VRALVVANTRTSVQHTIVAICLLITLIDGFDILSISFVAPAVAREWNLSPIALGVIFSSGLAGMALGALALSPLGDIFGRRTAIMWFLSLIGGGMLFTATAYDLTTMSTCRFITGLGIGAMVSNTGTIILEFVPPARRTACLGLVLVGTPIGALVSGYVALFAIGITGWEAVFICGGSLTLAMIPAVYFGLPESVQYLLGRRPRNALERLNAVLRRLNLAALERLPPPGDSMADREVRLTDVFRGDLLKRTIPVGLIHFICMFAYYAFVNWAAKLITQMGSSDSAGISVAMLINVGGIGGAILIGCLTARFGLMRTTMLGFCAFAGTLVLFGVVPEVLWLLGLVAVLAGFALFGTQVSLYSMVAASYPPSVRATAIGLAFSIGRIGSILGPYVAGVLLAYGAGRATLFIAIALPQLIAAVLVMGIPHEKSQAMSACAGAAGRPRPSTTTANG
jgi:benzoate transport